MNLKRNQWKKPTMTTVRERELRSHIAAAASNTCFFNNSRMIWD